MVKFGDALRDRFIRYTTYDTMSDDGLVGKRRPTTEGQDVLLAVLEKELEELGLETYFGEEKVVMGTLKGNTEGTTIGFMAHVDTASDCEGNHVKAQVWSNYDGGKIVLQGGVVLDPAEDKDLLLYKGGEIITSDGNTLLGSDDKAGVAIIMETLKYLVSHPEVKRPDIEVYFTPDEETGSGMDKFPYGKMKSSCCYTVDGGAEGWVELECFNAATVEVLIHGTSIHLGSARGKLVNAVTVGAHIITALPQAESPEATDGRYGYYCPLVFGGEALDARLQVFIRDFDKESFEHRIKVTEDIARSIGNLYGAEVTVKTKVSYRNMAEHSSHNPKATEAMYAAAAAMGGEIKEAIIRGGTDGARLAETKDMACPNLYTGGHNLHSPSEWVAVDAMERSANLTLGIIDYWSRQ